MGPNLPIEPPRFPTKGQSEREKKISEQEDVNQYNVLPISCWIKVNSNQIDKYIRKNGSDGKVRKIKPSVHNYFYIRVSLSL